mgnify:CR=1 FL=1
MDIIIRRAVPADVDAMLRLFDESIRGLAFKDYSPTEIDAWIGKADRDKWLHRIKEQHFMICEMESTLAGFSTITKEGYLDLLYVHPDYVGKGIATRLLSQMEGAARKFNCSQIEADVSLTAKGVFLVMGYEIVSEHLVSVGEEQLKNFKMIKIL